MSTESLINDAIETPGTLHKNFSKTTENDRKRAKNGLKRAKSLYISTKPNWTTLNAWNHSEIML